MKKKTFWFSVGAAPIVALGSVAGLAHPSQAASVQVACQTNTSTPTVTVTLAQAGAPQTVSILNFLPKYFSPQEAVKNCQNAANNLQPLYASNNGSYLTTGKLSNQTVVCAVERRGMSCNHDRAQVLFSLKPSADPAQALYDMLGNEFKPVKPLDSRTVGRIYTETKPSWWPF